MTIDSISISIFSMIIVMMMMMMMIDDDDDDDDDDDVFSWYHPIEWLGSLI